MELTLNFTLDNLHSRHGGAQIAPDIPGTLRSKLRYFKKAVRQMETDEQLVEYAVDVAATIKQAAEMRDNCVHSALRESDGRISSTMLKLFPRSAYRHKIMTIPQIEEAASVVSAIHYQLAWFCATQITPEHAKIFDNLARNLDRH